MLGVIILITLLSIELGFMIYSLVTKSYQKDKKSITKIILFVLITVFTLASVIQWGFQWYLLFLILIIKAIAGALYLLKRNNRKQKTYKPIHVIISTIGRILVITFAVLPAIIFPQHKPLEPTGNYKVGTVSYTLTDPDRIETFSKVKENRKVTIQFWYPENAEGKYPLVVFSHGAFGFRGSNRSTCENLASNGYVVCSIDHTYHSFFTKQTDGKTIIANMDFVNAAMAASNDEYDEQKTYELSHEWLKLRLGDVNFVLDDILAKVAGVETGTVKGSETVKESETVKGSDTVKGSGTVKGSETVKGSDTVKGSGTVKGSETVKGSGTVTGSDTDTDTDTDAESNTDTDTDTNTNKVTNMGTDAVSVYQLIDTAKIGLFGHSLGGATAAELGRERSDVDAVIVIDGTMLGEEIGFENGKTILNSNPYPIPILNMYNEEHYKEALEIADVYDNMVATANAVDARQIVIKGAGHLNFTDLPMFSPFLASLLGTGEVDSHYCIKTMNKIVLDYFNYYLKDSKELKLQAEY